MTLNKLITIIGLLLCIFGCGTYMSKEELQEHFYGIWYSEEFGYYLNILPDCNIIFYECTLHDGIEINKDISGHLSGGALTINDNGSESVFESGAIPQDHMLFYKDWLLRVESIPEICENDVIEIIDVKPSQVISGESTEFTVLFEYRLTSVNKAIIEGGLTASKNGTFLISIQNNLVVDSASFGIDSLQVTAVPQVFEDGSKCYFNINLSPVMRFNDYTPYSSDRFELDVIK